MKKNPGGKRAKSRSETELLCKIELKTVLSDVISLIIVAKSLLPTEFSGTATILTQAMVRLEIEKQECLK